MRENILNLSGYDKGAVISNIQFKSMVTSFSTIIYYFMLGSRIG